jgi:hypothetical protein
MWPSFSLRRCVEIPMIVWCSLIFVSINRVDRLQSGLAVFRDKIVAVGDAGCFKSIGPRVLTCSLTFAS